MVQLYLSIEISTQQVKVCAIDQLLKINYENSLNFHKDFSSYNTDRGVHEHEDYVTVTSPVKMWIEAVDRILKIMKEDLFDFENVVAISGTAQQHGSVYWILGARHLLQNLDPSLSLLIQLKNAFSIEDSPIWMDSSTNEQCLFIENNIGGAKRLSEITGCRAYHRITGNQILKIYQKNPDLYKNTERISLVSSFLGSLFLGDFCPIDYSDGSGMNLFDLKQKDWSQECLNAYNINNLSEKLGTVVPSSTVVGTISNYMTKRYNFNQKCKVVAFTGDNPASLAGMTPQHGDIIVSLGSSDTLFFSTEDPRPGLEGLILASPIHTDEYMAMLCFKNGSITREKIVKDVGVNDWFEFEKVLCDQPAGNGRNMGIYYYLPEITPSLHGIYRYDFNGQEVDKFDKKLEVRALIEGQFLSMRLHSSCMGLNIGSVNRILATGGASTNHSILQVLSDVFGAPVYVSEVSNSACLGSAYRALHADKQGQFEELVSSISKIATRVCTPNLDNTQIYKEMIPIFDQYLKQIAK